MLPVFLAPQVLAFFLQWMRPLPSFPGLRWRCPTAPTATRRLLGAPRNDIGLHESFKSSVFNCFAHLYESLQPSPFNSNNGPLPLLASLLFEYLLELNYLWFHSFSFMTF